MSKDKHTAEHSCCVCVCLCVSVYLCCAVSLCMWLFSCALGTHLLLLYSAHGFMLSMLQVYMLILCVCVCLCHIRCVCYSLGVCVLCVKYHTCMFRHKEPLFSFPLMFKYNNMIRYVSIEFCDINHTHRLLLSADSPFLFLSALSGNN